jgi:hypothetical protein
MSETMRPHLPLLVRDNTERTPRHRTAQKDVRRGLVLFEIHVRMVVLDYAFEQSPRAR